MSTRRRRAGPLSRCRTEAPAGLSRRQTGGPFPAGLIRPAHILPDLLLVRHLDEAEAAAIPRQLVLDDGDALHGAVRREGLNEVDFGDYILRIFMDEFLVYGRIPDLAGGTDYSYRKASAGLVLAVRKHWKPTVRQARMKAASEGSAKSGQLRLAR